MMIVPATAELLAPFYGDTPNRTCRAWVVMDDASKVVGIAGFYSDGMANVIFTDISDELRAHPRTILVLAKRIMKTLVEVGRPICAKCDFSIGASQRFLEHFGFVRINDEVFQWQA